MKAGSKDMTVGAMAARTGVPVSTLHYYEAMGLIRGWRTPAGHRRFDRAELRRVAVVRVAQSLGVPLAEIRATLDALPRDRPLTARDWAQVSATWRDQLEARIARLVGLRDQLGFCIGCGGLSLDTCPLYNADDRLSDDGPGPRRVLGPL
jgi:MerR family redox-sensitive transcriptional activator SoxR